LQLVKKSNEWQVIDNYYTISAYEFVNELGANVFLGYDDSPLMPNRVYL
jgi:hypothetical protein